MVSARRGIPFVVSAPSGTGKTTVCRGAVLRDASLSFAVSHTTRRARSGEREGVDYHFVAPERFSELVRQGAFLEHAEYSGNRYGTSCAVLEEILERGRDALLEIEIQGAEQIRRRRADARFIFLLPPTMEVLEERLRGRGTDAPEAVARRLALARREVLAVRWFDYAVVNDEIERAVGALLSIVRAERDGCAGAARERSGCAAVIARTGWLARALSAG